MLIKQYNKGKREFIVGLDINEFDEFLNKFYGNLIFRGKKKYSIKFVDFIFLKLKKKFKADPLIKLYFIINNLTPLFNLSQKKVGRKKFQYIPSLAIGKRRYFLILDWLIRKQKNKTNILGLNVKDISSKLIDANYNKGELIRLKRDFYKVALTNKYLLLKRKKKK